MNADRPDELPYAPTTLVSRRRVIGIAGGCVVAASVALFVFRLARRRSHRPGPVRRAFRVAQALAARERAEQAAAAVPVPEVVAPFVVVKRSNPRFGDTLGHWWLELDGTESYGWWPDRCPLPVGDWFRTVRGTLNGTGGTCCSACVTRDPHHGERADHEFHPLRIAPLGDAAVRAAIRTYATNFSGGWRARSVWPWSRRPSRDCRSFQLGLLQAAGLGESPEQLVTRGPGCPALVALRATAYLWRAVTRPRSIRTLPELNAPP